MSTTEQKPEPITKVLDLIKDIHISMMTTVDDQDNLVSRPMAVMHTDADGTIWFFTKRSSPKVDQIDNNPSRVNLSFSDEGNATYVSISGTATEVDDRAKIEEYWSPAAKPWFPGGKEDPELVLLKVDTQMAEYWDANSSRLVRLAQMVTGAITGTPPKMGENEKIYN